jgi:hypothetical protein
MCRGSQKRDECARVHRKGMNVQGGVHRKGMNVQGGVHRKGMNVQGFTEKG